MRELATIQMIENLLPIDGADKIEVAQIEGWHVVVHKGEFKIGDLCVYCEIDSILPERPEFEFLRDRKFRIKTIRLKGQISQGIAFPLSILDGKSFSSDTRDIKKYDWHVGQDVTELVGVTKYEPEIPACLSGLAKGTFPSFIPKTDEIRVQNIQSVLTKYKGTTCYITEKLDGSSVTFFVKDGEFGVCSRNLELKEDDKNSFWQAARELDIETKLKKIGINIAIQGELVGEGIQGNKLKLKGKSVYFYNAFIIDEYRYLNFMDFFFLFTEQLELPLVPILHINFELIDNIDELVHSATQRSMFNENVWREGIVIRAMEEIKCPEMFQHTHQTRLSFKVINPEFLLQYGE